MFDDRMSAPRRSGVMPTWQRWSFALGMGMCCVSGLGYWLAHTLALAPHGWAGRVWLSLHGMSASVAALLFGWVLAGHIRVGWQSRRNRVSGVANAVGLALLIVSSWALYYGSEDMRDTAVWAHESMGLLWIVVLGWHLVRFQSRR